MSSLSAPFVVLHAPDTAPAASLRRERVLLWALVLSLVFHLLGGSGVGDWLADQYEPEEPELGPPLRAVLKPPPPPMFQAAARPIPAKKKPRRRIPAPVVRAAEPVAEPVAQLADASVAAASAQPAAELPVEPPVNPPLELPVEPPVEPPVVPPAELPPPLPEHLPVVEPAPEPLPVPEPIRVPKRIDLIGKAFIGEQNFLVGTGGFRLRHDGNRYEISVLGQARGLARLLMSVSEFQGVSRGAITASGLQPSEYLEERGGPERRETATLDWEAGVIRLKDDKMVAIEPPTHDRLSVIMQFYYRPPDASELTMRVTGTRYIDTYVFRRHGDETLELAFADVAAHVWRVDYDDGKPRLELWMSPDYHYLPLKVRIHAQEKHGGRVATFTIDEIRVEE